MADEDLDAFERLASDPGANVVALIDALDYLIPEVRKLRYAVRYPSSVVGGEPHE